MLLSLTLKSITDNRVRIPFWKMKHWKESLGVIDYIPHLPLGNDFVCSVCLSVYLVVVVFFCSLNPLVFIMPN